MRDDSLGLCDVGRSLRSRWAGGRFTLIELLVVVVIITILAALLLPALGAARERAKRTLCMSNLKVVWIAMEMYVDDNEGHYRQHGSAGVRLHRMNDKAGWREEYLQNDPRPMYCPSADVRYNHQNPFDRRAMGYVGGNADNYFGYANWSGHGGDTRDSFAPTGWTKGRSKYSPTISRRHGEGLGNVVDRPIFSDMAGFTGTRARQEQGSDPAFPANNHQNNGNYLMSAWMNMVFMDGHGVGVNGPHAGGYQRRINHERSEVGDYYW